MKIAEYTDANGYRQKAFIRDNDTNPQQGIPLVMPDIEGMDWDRIKRRLHGLLLDKGLLTIEDIQQRPADFQWCIITAVKRPLLVLYQED